MLTNTRLCLLLLFFAVPHVPALAQNRREVEPVRLSGTLKDMGGGMLQVEAADGEMWLVKIAPRAKDVSYAGTAEPDWIRPGMWVRFRGNFNQKLQADGPIDQLTVFTPTEDSPLGVIPQNSLGDNLFSDEPEPERVDKNAPVPCAVAGRIVGVKKNKMTVAAGQASVTVEVLDDVRVTVEVADLSVARAGDQVEIEGWKYPMVSGRAMANRVTITSDKPLTAPKPKRSRADDKKLKNASDGNAVDGNTTLEGASEDSGGKDSPVKEKPPRDKGAEPTTEEAGLN